MGELLGSTSEINKTVASKIKNVLVVVFLLCTPINCIFLAETRTSDVQRVP